MTFFRGEIYYIAIFPPIQVRGGGNGYIAIFPGGMAMGEKWLYNTGLQPIGPRAYSPLFKYTQQHTAGFTENNNWAPRLLRPTLATDI